MPMTYADALAYLNGFVNYERGAAKIKSFELTRVLELAERVGNPQRHFPSLHVAGTKGKGSACAFMEWPSTRR